MTQASGRVVPVVQAYAFTKYLGFIKLTFDDQGELKQWAGAPILLNSSFPQGWTFLFRNESGFPDNFPKKIPV